MTTTYSRKIKRDCFVESSSDDVFLREEESIMTGEYYENVLISPPPSSPLREMSITNLNNVQGEPEISEIRERNISRILSKSVSARPSIKKKKKKKKQENTIISMLKAKAKWAKEDEENKENKDEDLGSNQSSDNGHDNGIYGNNNKDDNADDQSQQQAAEFIIQSKGTYNNIISFEKTPNSRPPRILFSKKLVQAQLLVGIDSQATCSLCGMSYAPVLKSDVKSHEKFHSRALDGRPWADSWGTRVNIINSGTTANTTNSTSGHDNNLMTKKSNNEYIVKVDASSKPSEKNAVQDIIDLVNTELNASPENPAWKTRHGHGAAYIYVYNKRATALLLVERISKGHWMEVSTGQLLGGPVLPLIMGVSRIFTARNFRQKGMATKLLDASINNFIYGLRIDRRCVGWSQPTATGAKVASKWAGFTREEQTKLIVYLESDV